MRYSGGERIDTEAFVIAGPTCVGKTAYIRRLLDQYPFEVINLDSFQIFEHFLVGTGRADSTFGNRGHLYGFIEPDQKLSPESYVTLAKASMEGVRQRGNISLFEGGSISYLKALISQVKLTLFVLVPPSDDWLREAVKKRLDSADRQGLFAEIVGAKQKRWDVDQILKDDVVYRPAVEYLDGSINLETAGKRMTSNLMRRARDQLRAYDTFDAIRVTAGQSDTLLKIANVIDAKLGRHR